MVHMPQMRDLVRDGGAADMVGRHDESPAVAQVAVMGAAAPAAARIADPDAADGQPCPRRNLPALARHDIERRGLQPALEAAPDGFGGAADTQPVALGANRARGGRRPFDPALHAEQRQRRAGADPDRRGGLADLFGEPVLLLARPFDRARGACAARQRQSQLAARTVEDQAIAARLRMRDQSHRPRRIADPDVRLLVAGPFAAHQTTRSTRWFSSGPARSSLTVQPTIDSPARCTASRSPQTR